MTFDRFEQLVKAKYPGVKLFPHGKFAEGVKSKINVGVIFHENSKVYTYNGTYCEVLNRLGIKAIYKHDLKAAEEHLEYAKNTNGRENIFSGKIIDKTAEIEELKTLLNDYYTNYIVV